jgi:hypothetical protein
LGGSAASGLRDKPHICYNITYSLRRQLKPSEEAFLFIIFPFLF